MLSLMIKKVLYFMNLTESEFAGGNMLTIKRAKIEDAEEITKIKTLAFNKEINTYLGREM